MYLLTNTYNFNNALYCLVWRLTALFAVNTKLISANIHYLLIRKLADVRQYLLHCLKITMHHLPPFMESFLSPTSILSSAEQRVEQLLHKYSSLKLTDDELLTKISSDLDNVDDPLNILQKTSEEFREMFKEAAIRDGHTTIYVQGVFDTAEKIVKEAINLSGIGRALSHELPEAEQAAAHAVPPRLPPPLPTQVKTPLTEPVGQGSEPQLSANSPSESEGAVIPPMENNSQSPGTTGMSGLMNKIRGKVPLKNSFLNTVWNGTNQGGNKTFTERNMGPAATAASGLIAGPGGLAASVPLALAHRFGLRNLGMTGAALPLASAGLAGGAYLGGKALGATGIPGGVARGAENFVGGTSGDSSDPYSSQNDALPGIGNGFTGGAAGLILASLLAKQQGLTGLPGMALSLLGAYGGYKYLPQLLAKFKNGGGLEGLSSNNNSSGIGSYPMNGGINIPNSMSQLAGSQAGG